MYSASGELSRTFKDNRATSTWTQLLETSKGFTKQSHDNRYKSSISNMPRELYT